MRRSSVQLSFRSRVLHSSSVFSLFSPRHPVRVVQGYGVFRFDSKYGANVDGYSPIWSPNEWSETGDTYKAGAAGLAIWCVFSRS